MKVISRFGLGYDAIDLEALRRKGIRLAISRGCMPYAVARQTVGFLLSITFNFIEHYLALNQGKWLRTANRSCSDTMLGILGMGAVGREVARIAGLLGYRVAAYSRSMATCEGLFIADSFKNLVQQSDIISLHVPLTPGTRELISGEVLGWLSGKSLINTARGGLVSERQILDALNAGLLRYYATDVFSVEPIGAISKELAAHERVICTPHVGAFDRVTARLMLRQAVSNAIHCLNGRHEAVNAYVL